jgi:hypothetical protein
MKRIILLFLIMSTLTASAQKIDTVFLKKLLQSRPDLFSAILNHPQQNEVQLLYTQIDRDKNNVPHFKSYSYRLSPKRYFYPASTVKLPTAIFGLEKLNELKIAGLTKDAIMITDSAFAGQSKVIKDPSSQSGLPSISHYIKKILLVSDNDAYNRLYEFVGREEINQKLKKYGFNQTRIVGRLAVGDGGEGAKHTNPVTFYQGDKPVYQQPAMYDKNEYPMTLNYMVQGKGYLDKDDKLVMQPFDFSGKNVYTIADQQAVLKRLMFPEVYKAGERFNLSKDDYQLIYRYMSMLATESDDPAYKQPEYFPAFCKFLYYGSDSSAVINPDVRIFNKIGDSYGYLIDNAYIVDFKHKVEFMLTAVVQSNEDGIYNDNKYEYETVCQPFMKNIGQVIYQHELKRKKKNLPDLSKFKFTYK